MNPIQRHAIEFLIGKGWSVAQAAGLVANFIRESKLDPRAVGDSGLALGIAQWHPPRREHFEALLGKPFEQSTLDDQLHWVHAELQTTEKAAGTALAGCATAAEAGDCVSRRYERPADRDGEATKRAALAEQLFIEYGGAAAGSIGVPPPPPPPTPPSSSVATPSPPENRMLPAFLLQLLPMITGAFTQGGQAQLQPLLNRPADQIGPLLLNLFSMVAQQTGVVPAGQKIATDEQAIAAVAELNKQKATNSQLVAQIEAQALGYLADMGPLFDRLVAADAAENTARREGRQSASSVAIEEHKAGLWDMTRTLVTSLLIMLGGVAGGLLAAIIGLVFRDKPDPTLIAALIGLAGPIWTGAIVATVVAIVAYRFDGSAATNAARAISNQLDIAGRRVQ